MTQEWMVAVNGGAEHARRIERFSGEGAEQRARLVAERYANCWDAVEVYVGPIAAAYIPAPTS